MQSRNGPQRSSLGDQNTFFTSINHEPATAETLKLTGYFPTKAAYKRRRSFFIAYHNWNFVSGLLPFDYCTPQEILIKKN